MKVQKKRFWSRAIRFAFTTVLSTALAFTGCSNGDDDDDSGSAPPSETEIVEVSRLDVRDSKDDVSSGVALGGTVELTVTVSPGTATDKTVTWTSSSEKVTLSPKTTNAKSAKVTATVGEDTEEKEVTITATSSNGKTATYTINVLPKSTLNFTNLQLSAISGEVKQNGKTTITVTAVAENTAKADDDTIKYEYEWSATGSGITLDNDDTNIVTVKVAGTAATTTSKITVRVTASSDHSSPLTDSREYTLKVIEGEAYPYTLYKEDFSDIDDPSTLLPAISNGTQQVIDEVNGQENVFNVQLSNAGGDRSEVFTIADTGYAAGTQAKISFLLKTTATGQNDSSYFVQDSSGVTIFGLSHGNISAKDPSLLYYIGGTDKEENTVEGDAPAGKLDTTISAIERYTTAWMRVTADIDFAASSNNVTLTVIDVENNTTLVNGLKGTTDATNIAKLAFTLGRSYGAFAIDDIEIKAAEDEILLSTPIITVKDDATNIAATGSATLTGDVSCVAASEPTKQLPVIYAWTLAEGDNDYATLSETSGPTTVITGKNGTINDKKVTVTLSVVPSDALTVTGEQKQTITVLADDTLLSDVKLSAEANATTVHAGSTLKLTLTGGESHAEDDEATVAFKWASDNEEYARVKADDGGRSAIVTGLKSLKNGTVKITATATLGSIKKEATYELTVAESLAKLERISVVDDADDDATKGVTVLNGLTTSLTAATNDMVEADSWRWESANPNIVKVDFTSAVGSSNTAQLIGVAASGSTTVTVTATKGSVSVKKEISVTVKGKNENSLFSQDFTNVTDVTTVFATTDGETTGEIKQDATHGNYLYWKSTVTRAQRPGYTTQELKAPQSGTYYIDFDAMLDDGSDRAHAFAIVDSAASTPQAGNNNLEEGWISSWVLHMQTETANGAPAAASRDWVLFNGAEKSEIKVNLESTSWYHFHLEVSIADGTTTITITKEDGTTVLAATTVKANGNRQAGKFVFLGARTNAAIGLDNIKIYNYVAQ